MTLHRDPISDDFLRQVRQEVADSMLQIVATIDGVELTRGDLDKRFKLVQDKLHWKNHIHKIVKIPGGLDGYERKVIEEAIVFFTGSKPTFTYAGGGKYLVQAAGYFATIGA